MAELVLAAATPHNPLLWRAMREPYPPDLVAVEANFRRIREAIAEAEVDALIVLGTDHVRQFFADNSPAFIVGKAASYHGTYENEVRTFGMEYAELTGHPELAAQIAGREVLPEAIDFSVSHEWRLDHSFVLPLQYVRPELDLPIVPIHANAILPPLPSAARFAALGHHLRAAVESWDGGARVALLTSGHMATDVGGPRTFNGSPDPAFD
ncbi:DODA-type extradiol aromatic ring-opening family dioxygenase, partial [Streptomyces phaeoluteigriseus]